MKMAKDKKKAIDAEINKVLLDDFDKFDSLVHRRWKEMLYCAVGIIVVIAVAYSIYLSQNKKKDIAIDKLAAATTETELLAAINQYGSYSATNAARVRLANIYVNDGKYDDALVQMNAILKNDANDEFKSRAALDIGYILEKSNKVDEAKSSYLAVANNTQNDNSIRMEAFYAAARVAVKANEKDSAKSYLENVNNLAKNRMTQEDLWTFLSKSLLASLD